MSEFGSLQIVVKTNCFISIVVHCTDLNYGHCGMTMLTRCAYSAVMERSPFLKRAGANSFAVSWSITGGTSSGPIRQLLHDRWPLKCTFIDMYKSHSDENVVYV